MISKVLQSYGSLTIIRILSRVFQFLLKTYLIRNTLDKEILGHMIHLDLVVTISLHILKSCFKQSYQKVSDTTKIQKNIFSGMNLMNLGILTTCISSFLICLFQLYHYQNLQVQKRLLNLNYAIIIYGISVVNQALFQKFNVPNVLHYNYTKSAIIQMSSFLPKTLFIFIAAQTGMFQKYGILVFGIGHFIYTFLLLVISYFTNQSKYRRLFNIKILYQQVEKGQSSKNEYVEKGQSSKNQQVEKGQQSKKQPKPQQQYYYIDQKTKQSAKQFFSLSIIKLLIQQFQKIVLVTLQITSFSSIYVLISNLGSIVVRYVFAPLQQIVYNYFSRGDQKQSISTLILLIKSITLFSCLSLTFGYNYSQTFLGFLYGQRWLSDDSALALQIYTVFLSVIGINGIMESFLFAKGKQSIKKYKYIAIIPNVLYTVFGFIFIKYTQLGTGSFFLANCISMVVRIIVSWNLQIKKHISLTRFLVSIKPSKMFLLSILLTFLLGNSSTPYLGIKKYNHYIKDMLVGGLLFTINVSVILFQNRDIIRKKIKQKLSKRNKTE